MDRAPAGEDSVGTADCTGLHREVRRLRNGDEGHWRTAAGARRTEEEQETEVRESEEVRERQDKLTDDVDAILDEIDEVLEENAEEFVRSYVQKGGE